MSQLLRQGGLSLLLMLGLSFSPLLFAANGDITLFSTTNSATGQDYNVKIEILILMTLLGLLPIMLLMMTCFTRFIIVLAILRQALGLQQSPPNKILTGIALALTLLVMRPVWTTVYDEAIVPFQNDEITMQQALAKAEVPIKKYMLAQTNNKAMSQMMDIAGVQGDSREQDLTVVTPAYLLSELKTAFQIGFMIYIPFLVIDLIVASVLMAMGMMMLSPLIVSLPFKLMLFVLCDGWTLIVGTLTSSVQGL
ncbi:MULTISPECIES: flagellar type III secretion system pore protein FliP [unclassified Serratia (in: enterobacteria)]|uniref:flagellar type III secretion system pore protein FliP n=1 Tax=unclassified Serratia (in: enterobacteria) TaxID=2647522 RepID=UPI000507257B|nr:MULTISPECIES: flagellar type III secretion system pore protein FliP [unclassified Serratia (in: enterobacteria)]KFK95365.1 flagellar biosynthesis protein flip [Serratia sp. Ag2]KFK98713.1 flagellar biosynthesis protein flip [Serratia sp. Ag1]